MKRNLTIAVILLFLVWLASLAIFLLFLAGLASKPDLVAAIVCQVGGAVITGALLLVTNTRVPWPHDAWGATTDDLLRPAVQLPDGLAYGRRAHDDRNVVARLSEILESEADRRKPGETPAWVIGVHAAHDAPMEEP